MSLSLKDKKVLAEWMGMVFLPGNELENWGKFHKAWNPDTNLKQFKEIWNNLIIQEIRLVIDELNTNMRPDTIAYLIFNDLPRVCKAVIEVIK